MKINIKIAASLVITLFFSVGLNTQLITNTGISPAALVEDVLVGDGVIVSDVSYTGTLEAIGSFNGSSTNVGLNSGIILTTGTVNDEVGGISGEQRGPFGPNDTGSSGKANGEPGYGPLTAIAGVDTENAAILEFDFVPQSDTVRFRYVFGSDEYPEFVDEGFNDAFAFFISGPGFGGTYNMAQIPGGGGPVSIDNINNGPTNSGPCQNCSYYNENGTGSESPYADSPFYIQYDGFTDVIEAVAEVQCGETYHLIIAIADAGDQAYDSGIFLEANSLSSFAAVEMEASLDLDGFGDGSSMAEGCETATITISRTNTEGPLTLPITTLGDATEGVDYEDVPNEVTFAPGVAEVSFTIEIYSDAIIEGSEELIIELNHPDPCGEDNFITVELTIEDIVPVEATINDVEVSCPGEEAELTVNVTGGLPAYSYLWNTGATTPTISVAPVTTTTYSVTVEDICTGIPAFAEGDIIVPVFPPLGVNTTPDTSVLCPNTPLVLASEGFGGNGTYTYAWYDDGVLISSTPYVNVSPMVTTSYTIRVQDGCGNVIEQIVTVTVIASVLELEMSPDQKICPGDEADLWVIATEGLGDYTYIWEHSGETTPEVMVSPNNTTTYTVSVQDACATYSIEGETRVEVIRPMANFEILTKDPMVDLLVSFKNTSVDGVTWDWDLGNGDFSNDHSPTSTYNPSGCYEITLIAYNEIGCSDTVTKPLYVKPEFYIYAPNAFTPGDGRFNNEYSVSVIGAIQFEFQIFNRWGEMIYATSDQYFSWDGTYNGHLVSDNVLVYRMTVTDRQYEVHEYEGTITLLR